MTNTVRIVRPDLTPEEYEKRMAAIRAATVNVFLALEKAKQKKEADS